MSVIEVEQKFEKLHQEQQARASGLQEELDAARRDLKAAQDAQAKAEAKAAKADDLKAQVKDLQAKLALADAENTSLLDALADASAKIDAADAIAEGISTLNALR